MSRVVCLVQHAPERISFTWSDGPDTFPTYALTGQTADRFRERVTGVHDSNRDPVDGLRDKLRNLVGVYLDDLNVPSADGPATVRRASLDLAKAGYELRRLVFAPNEDPGKAARDVAAWLTRLQAQGAIESLEVIAEGGPPVPWTLLYENKPDERAFLAGEQGLDHWNGFWGLRFNLSGGQRVDPRRRMPWWNAPNVLLVVDPLVRQGLPEAIRARLDAFAAARGLTLIGSRAELEAALSGRRPDLLYWLGHASPEALVLGDGPGSEIRPNDLLDLLAGDGDAVPGGLVFLNACRTAEASPGAGSFTRAVFEQKMGGLIATEQQTLDTFAAVLGLDFLEAFLDGGEPVGVAMRKLRARVPLGLLYGTYCPPEIRVVRSVIAPAAVAIDTTAPAPGVALGPSVPPLREWPPLPAHPYRSLRAYSESDRALLAGREDAAARFAQLLDDSNTRLLILHGESGVGKTSFLRAAVIPYLEHDCIGYRLARNRSHAERDPILLVRATNDPVTQIAAALAASAATPFRYRTPAGEEVEVDLPAVLREAAGGFTGPDGMRDALRTDAGLLAHVLNALSTALPFTPILVIDQAEEMFTLARTPADVDNRTHALEMLRRAANGPGGFKLVVSLRTEYHGRFVDRLRKGTRDAGGVRDYLLTDFGPEALIEVIRRPTATTRIAYASDVPFEKYQFRYADGVAEEIAKRARAYTINRQDSVLPLVQVICTQLYALAKARPGATITLTDLDRIGGFEGGMKRHAEGLVRRLFPHRADQKAFRRLLSDQETQLYLRQSDGTLTTALLPAEFLAAHWAGRTPFDDMLRTAESGDWRLLRVNSLRIGSDDAERPYVSLGHDALAKVAVRWHDETARAAQRRKYAWRFAAAAVVLIGVWAAGHMVQKREEATGLVERLRDAETRNVPEIVREINKSRWWVDPRLRKSWDREPDQTREKLHLAMALVPAVAEPGNAPVEYLFDRLFDAEPEDVLAIRDVLEPHKSLLLDRLWAVANSSDHAKEAQRLRAAAALAVYDSQNERWADLGPRVVASLVRQNPIELGRWRRAFLDSTVAWAVLDPLKTHYSDRRADRAAERVTATNILVQFFTDLDADYLADLVMEADRSQFAIVYPKVQPRSDAVGSVLGREIDKALPADVPASDDRREQLAKRQANAAVALLGMNHPEHVWPLLKHSPDPRVRSYLIDRIAWGGLDPRMLIARLHAETDASVKRALLLCLGGFGPDRLAVDVRLSLVPALLNSYRDDPDPGLHAAAEWLLRQWGEDARLSVADAEMGQESRRIARLQQIQQLLQREKGTAAPQWYVNDQGHTMVVIPGPVEFMMGSPDTEQFRSPSDERLHAKRIERTFAVAAKPVSVEQFLRFNPEHDSYPPIYGFPPTKPVVNVDWYSAAAYCNWLSKREGIPEDQWCYVTYPRGMTGPWVKVLGLRKNYLRLSGYRLPSEAEVEYATRAGARTARPFGETDELLPRYAWYDRNSYGLTSPLGRLKPNDLGVFDSLGHVLTWCQEVYLLQPRCKTDEEDALLIDPGEYRALRGGLYLTPPAWERSAFRYFMYPQFRNCFIGFRIARTVPTPG